MEEEEMKSNEALNILKINRDFLFKCDCSERVAYDMAILALELQPELLEALKNLIKAYTYKDDECESNRFNATNQAEQAIAKSERSG